jgi:hypothetical protein
MSRSLGNRLPPALVSLLDGQDIPAKTGVAFLLATVDAEGRPHPALLSVGEVLAPDAGEVRLALYTTSSTTRNLRRGGAFTIALAHGGMGYYVKCTAREVADGVPGLAAFKASVDEVLEDGEPIARVTSGFAIELAPGGERVIAAWEKTVAALRALD